MAFLDVEFRMSYLKKKEPDSDKKKTNQERLSEKVLKELNVSVDEDRFKLPHGALPQDYERKWHRGMLNTHHIQVARSVVIGDEGIIIGWGIGDSIVLKYSAGVFGSISNLLAVN